jgi:hypothetical protein
MKASILWLCISVFAVARQSPTEMPLPASKSEIAVGIVYNDINRNNQRDEGEKGIANVRVSNGQEIVVTDRKGHYQIPVDDETIIFVLKPKNWMTPVNQNQLPQFYYIHKPNGSPKLKFGGSKPTGLLPESVDFPLYKVNEPTAFKVIMFGDPQITCKESLDYLARELEEIVGKTDAVFGISLGDISSDWLPFFDPANEIISKLGLPWYNVHGNHDRDLDADNDDHSNETFERVYGPAYYAFDYGEVHFILLDTVASKRWKPEDEHLGYQGGLEDKQIEFVRNDLAGVPNEKLVVLAMHIPLEHQQYNSESLKTFFDQIADRPNLMAVASHTHNMHNRFLDADDKWSGEKPLHMMILGTVCGIWWQGSLTEENVPHTTMSCGTPNGYGVFQFDRNRYSMKYRCFDFPQDYQMRIWTPAKVSAKQAAETEVYVNFFAGSYRDNLEMKFGDQGQWTKMQWSPEIDPFFRKHYEWEKSLNQNLPEMKFPLSNHIWKSFLPANPPKGAHVIHVQATDSYGQKFQGKRIIRIE